ADSGHVIALYRPLIIIHLARKFRPEEVTLVERLANEGMRARLRGGMLFVFARKDLTGGLDPEARAAFERLTRRNGEAAGASAVVVPAEGFGSAVVRSFIAGLVQLTAMRRKISVFGSVEDACRWLAKEHGLEPAELEDAYRRAVGHMPSSTVAQP